MKLFLVEGVVFRWYDGEDQERLQDTRLVMAEDETAAKRKYEKWWEDQSEDQTVSYCAYANQAKGVIE
jgi:hypothetical protein